MSLYEALLTIPFPTASALALLTGIGLWVDGPFEFWTAWIIIALAGFLVSAGLGAGRLGATTEAAAEAGHQARLAGAQYGISRPRAGLNVRFSG